MTEKTAAELQEEADAQARARGDIIDADNPPGDLKGDADEDGENVDLDAAAPRKKSIGESDAGDEDAQLGADADEEQGGDAEGSDEDDAPITIPKARFDAAQRKARERQQELERRIHEMEGTLETKATKTDLSKMTEELEELNTQYEDFLLDGEVDKARAVRRDRDKKQNDIIDARLNQQGAAVSKGAVDQMRFDAQLAQFEAKYPAINPDSDNFDQDIVNEVNEMLEVYKNSGFTLAAALNKAVHYVVPTETKSVGEDPDVVRKKRSMQARKKVAKVAKKSPPDLKDKGRDSDKSGSGDGLPDVTKMSPEQFAKLGEEDLKKMRGDSLSDEEAA